MELAWSTEEAQKFHSVMTSQTPILGSNHSSYLC